MQNPASPPAFRRTCPSCNRPVLPGYKFCETCGTQMPELSTCSRCGTQFSAPEKYCAICGAPMIPGEGPGPDDSQERSPEENAGPAEVQLSERQDEEMPEPVHDQSPEAHEERFLPDKIETPHLYKKEIQEPDTDALLEEFGAEYDERETLASSHHKPKSEAVDDVLFFSEGKRESTAKPRGNTTRILGVCVVLIAIIAAVYFIGLPVLSGIGAGAHSNQTAAGTTSVPTIAGTIPPTRVTTTTPAPHSLVPLPTQLVPGGQNLHFDVQKNPVNARISVIFSGSAGEGSIKSADVQVTHPDGSMATGTIEPLEGINEISLEGTNKTDRVEILARMSNGASYRVYDALVALMT